MLKFCPSCGTKIAHENIKFCMNCGQALDIFLKADTSDAKKQDIQNDFFAEALTENNSLEATITNTENQDDFFSSMENEADKLQNADQELLNKAESLFLKYKLKETKPILEDLASRKNLRAQYMLSCIYEEGIEGSSSDVESSYQILYDAAKFVDGKYEDNPDALIVELKFVRKYMVNNDAISTKVLSEIINEINRRISRVGEISDAFVEYELGEYYASKDFGNQNMEKALMLFDRAAQKSFWISMDTAGVLHYFVKKDFRTATKRLRPIADKGYPDAIIHLAQIYFQEGTDIQRTEYWALKGANFNDSLCLYIMGSIKEVEGNYYDAISWYEKNIQINKHELSMADLGMLYLNMNDNSAIPTDRAKAEGLFLEVLNIDKNNAKALLGLGITQIYKGDSTTAKQLLQQAYSFGEGDVKETSLTILNQVQEYEKEQSQNSGCFITTAVCDNFGKPDDCYELTMFRKFRDTWLLEQEDGESLVKEYYAIAPHIVSKIDLLNNAKEIYHGIWVDYLKPCLLDLESDNKISCKERYVQMVMELKEKYMK